MINAVSAAIVCCFGTCIFTSGIAFKNYYITGFGALVLAGGLNMAMQTDKINKTGD